MRKFIIFLVLVYASFLNAAPTCNAGNIAQLRSCANSVNNNGTIYITNDITNISYFDLPIVIRKNFVSIKGSNPSHRAVISTNNLVRRLFDIQSKRRISFENLSLSAYVGVMEFSRVSNRNHTKKLEFTNVKIEQTGPIAGYTTMSYNYAYGNFNTEFTMIDSEVSGYNALEIKRAKNVNILTSSIQGGISGVKFIDSENVTMIDTNASAIAGGSSLGVVTGAINIDSAENVNILGGVIKGYSTVGSRAIIIGNSTDKVYMQDTCVSGGYFNVGISNRGSHSFDVKNSIFRNYTYRLNYSTYSGIWYRTNTKVNINNSCFYEGSYRNKPLPEYGNNLVTNNITGNYWENHGNGQESLYDNGTSLSRCPPTNNCIYQPPEPELVSEHRFDGCRLSDGSIDIDSNDTTYNGTLDKMVATDPIFAERKVCNAMTFYDDGEGTIQIPNVHNLLNQTASLAFWIRTTQIGGTQTWNSPGIFGQEIVGTSRDIFWGWINQNGKIGVSTGNDVTSVSNTSINDGYWHHVVLTRDASYNRYKIYIDGALEKSGQMEDNGASTPSLQGVDYSSLGKIERGTFSGGVTTDVDDGTSRYFYGSLDELKIYSGILSNSQVQDIYNNENAGNNYDGSTRTCSCSELNQCYDNDFNNDENDTWEVIPNSNQVSGNAFIDYFPEVISGKLSITKAESQIRAGVSINGEIPSNNVILTEFKHLAYGGNPAVGTAFVFSDALVEPSLGGYISSLGYAQSQDTTAYSPTDPLPIRNEGVVSGFAGGWLGVGFDEHGYFSSNNYKRLQGGPSNITPNSIAIRGRTTSSTSTSTNYLKGTSTLSPVISTGSSGRDYRVALQNNTKMVSISRLIGGKWQRFANYDITQSGSVPSDLKVSFTATNGGWNQNHEIDNLNFKAVDCGTIGKKKPKPKPKLYKFDAWDTFRSINDRNISTKIVNSSFDLNISALNESGSDFQDFNGTVCVRIVDNSSQSLSSWQRWQAEDKNITTLSFTSPKASKNARAEIVWKRDDLTTNCPISDETNSTLSTDNFAIKPNAFNINAPTTIKSGEDFNITFEGLQSGGGTASDYNESVNSSFLVNFKEQKAGCINGNFDNNISSGWDFANGTKTLLNSYDEVGIVDINISDTNLTCNELYAKVDCKDKNISGHWNTDDDVEIGEDTTAITFTLDHFEIDADLSNFQGGNFTYLSNDVMNMYAPLDINLMAKNADGNITKNYNPDCYAKTSDLDISYEHTTINPDIINTIITHELNTSSDLNQTFSDKKLDLSLPNTIFDDGNASLHVRLNFDRNISTPINPFDINISDIDISDSDGVTDTVQTVDGNASFFYGRARPVDLTTTSNSARTYGEFEIYDTNARTNMLQNSLHWYRNRLHVNSNYGRLTNPRDSIFSGTVPSATTMLNVTLGAGVNMGLQNINISNTLASSVTRTVHFETNTWLWFTSSDNPQPYSANGSCLTHPCLDYEFRVSGAAIVHSGGNFHGSDVNLSNFNSNQTEKRGVKVFR